MSIATPGRVGLAAALAALAVPAALGQTPSAAPAPLVGCDSEESRQFDFWVGEWEVYPAAQPETKVADSLIEKLYAGCAIRENWMPLSGADGGSLSAYVSADKGWRQTWVDSSGGFVEFAGGFADGKMTIEGVWPQPGKPEQITRMTYSVLEDGSVRQFGEASDDDGATWAPAFDLIYRRKAQAD